MLYAGLALAWLLVVMFMAYAHDINVLKNSTGILYTHNGRVVLVTRDVTDNRYRRLVFKLEAKNLHHRGYKFASVREL